MKKQKYPPFDVRQFKVFEHLFLSWLASEDLYDGFARGLRARGFRGGVQNYIAPFYYQSYRSPSDLFACAFTWSKTPEGAEFWRKASAAWECYVKDFANFLK